MYWCVQLVDRGSGQPTMVATEAESAEAARQQFLSSGMVVGPALPLQIPGSLVPGRSQEADRRGEMLATFLRNDRFTHRPALAIAQGLWLAVAGIVLVWLVIVTITFALGLLSLAGLARSASRPPPAPQMWRAP